MENKWSGQDLNPGQSEVRALPLCPAGAPQRPGDSRACWADTRWQNLSLHPCGPRTPTCASPAPPDRDVAGGSSHGDSRLPSALPGVVPACSSCVVHASHMTATVHFADGETEALKSPRHGTVRTVTQVLLILILAAFLHTPDPGRTSWGPLPREPSRQNPGHGHTAVTSAGVCRQDEDPRGDTHAVTGGPDEPASAICGTEGRLRGWASLRRVAVRMAPGFPGWPLTPRFSSSKTASEFSTFEDAGS